MAPAEATMKKVLIVDDEPVVRRFIKISLKGQYATDEAGNGEEALRKTEKEEFDCVITDVQMPQMDGIKLLSELKRKRPKTSVIVMSGGADYSKEAMKNGAIYFLAKPFLLTSLYSALQGV
jgi:YesN/AraC family two-component response regulator